MKLQEGEKIINEYYFSQTNDAFQKGILTTKRLVCITKNSSYQESEENYPLSKLTSVQVERTKNGFRSKVLGVAVVLLVALIWCTIFMATDNHTSIDELSILVIPYAIIIWLIRFGLKPDKIITNLIINQLGGTKKYTARHSEQLQEFIDEINGMLV